METITCNVNRVIYRNSENGYSVLAVTTSAGKDTSVVGVIPTAASGSSLVCEGDWVNSKFGLQFSVSSYRENLPADEDGITKYLASGFIKGVGPSLASAIVNTFGIDTVRIIEEFPERLKEVPGVGAKKAAKISQSWKENMGIKNVMIFLQAHGVGTSMAFRIYTKYRDDSISTITENPYVLAQEVDGIGFKTADAIAATLGITGEDRNRCMAGIHYALTEASAQGNVYLPEEGLVTASRELLDVREDRIRECLCDMKKGEILIADEDRIYIPPLYWAERGAAWRLSALMRGDCPTPDKSVDELLKDSDIEYDEVQKDAVGMAISSAVMVLTGGPGTGKTTTVNGIIKALCANEGKILLAAPTGRAAKRMTEATGLPSKTLHRLLEYNPREGFARNDKNPLRGDALIVDECSMIDVPLMNSLLRAVPRGMRLILVGDVDQLPSVGVGNVLRDIIDSGKIPVTRLTRIFRQAGQSLIITNAHAINRGQVPVTDNPAGSDFFFISHDDAETMPRQILSLVRDRLPRCYGCSPQDIQVLTPMRRGPIGTQSLNKVLQEAVNPTGPSLTFGFNIYRLGDRVMQIRNNYDKGVFNGDLGYIMEVNEEDDTMMVDYDGTLVEYKRLELDEVTLAYASTIHKSQGSEYPIVVIPIHTSHYIMLQRNLLYTGVTRAKKVCVLIGSKRAVGIAVHNQPVLNRYSNLRGLLEEAQ